MHEEMRRLIEDALLQWKRQATRNPLLLDGARQVGKTYLLERIFGSHEFRRVHRIDFRRDPSLEALFSGSLDPRAILSNLELRLDTSLDLSRDLIFIDEVGDCQRALDSLKYFAEDLPQAFVCASSSNIGLLDSFPVRQVQQLSLSPLCFEEFLMATSTERLLDAYRERRRDSEVHRQLGSQLRDYCFVGGMPEAVATWMQRGPGTKERADRVKQIQREVVLEYERDFVRYAGSIPAQHIGAVFSDVPRQLAGIQDGSVRRFKFGGVIAKKKRYQELRGPVDWLEAARLVRKNHPILGRPEPLSVARARQNIFKLFSFDIGVLGNMVGLSYADHREQTSERKGFIAENFVQNELSVHVGYPTYGWEQAHAEIEFLHRCRNGEVIPVEVKSGSRTRARSLRSFIDRYSPSRAVKLVGSPDAKPNGVIQSWPLYDAMFLRDL